MMDAVIRSKHNREYKKIAQCKTRKGREKWGLFLLEGEKPIREALQAGLLPHRLYVREGSDVQADVRRQAADVLHVLSADLFDALCDTVNPQDLLYVGRILHDGLEDVASGADVVVLDRLQDPGNAGTVLRTSAAAGIRYVLVMPGTVDLFNPKVLRSAAGALFGLRVVRVPSEEALLHWVALRNIELVCADVCGDVDLFDLAVRSPQALVVGNEHGGPSDAMTRDAAQLVRIPMPGGTESLNASVAASLLIYEHLRKKRN